MIALEIQALSERREGLLLEIGRAVTESGFTLQQQRLTKGRYGFLLTMVVQGPARKKRALSNALGAHDRLNSFVISAFDENVKKPHFAAAFKHPPRAGTAAPSPHNAPRPRLKPASLASVPEANAPIVYLVLSPVPAIAPVSKPEVALAADTATSVSAPACVELIALAPDLSAIDQLIPTLTHDYPSLLPKFLTLQASVVEAAPESSLLLAGQRMGAWVFERDYAASVRLALHDAVERVAFPALRALVKVEQRG